MAGIGRATASDAEAQIVVPETAAATGGKAGVKAPDVKRYRLYQAWPGSNRFCCQGVAVTGSPGGVWKASNCVLACCPPGTSCGRAGSAVAACLRFFDLLEHPPCLEFSAGNICAWSFILAPSMLYYFVALPYLWNEVHPALPLFTIFLFFFSVSCLCLSCCSDPGIIPRREVILATGSRERLKSHLGYDVLGECVDGNLSTASVPHDLQARGYRWCTTCKIVRPPRASHCPDCDNCVLRFDHHCPFVNNCVGQRNYVFFIGFTSSVCCLAIFVLPVLVWALLNLQTSASNDDGEAHSSNVITGALIALAAAAGVVALLVFALWVYHLFLICTGRTTKEHWKGIGHKEELSVLTFRGPRLYNPRAWVEAVPVGPDRRKEERRSLELYISGKSVLPDQASQARPANDP